jgi:hypothetical protein
VVGKTHGWCATAFSRAKVNVTMKPQDEVLGLMYARGFIAKPFNFTPKAQDEHA